MGTARNQVPPQSQLLLCGAGGGVGVLMDPESQLSHVFKGADVVKSENSDLINFASYSHSKMYHRGNNEAAGWIWTMVI